MTPFSASTADMLLALQCLPPDARPDADERALASSLLEAAASLAEGEFASLRQSGDRQGARLDADGVRLPAGFAEAYQAYVAGGWNGMGFDEADGGMGLPLRLAMPVLEIFQAANPGLAQIMMLNVGAAELVAAHADADLRALYLPAMVSGRWTGTMQLTEPQAGSDLGLIRTRAEPRADGRYALFGTKIYITGGEHDGAENIIHLVLARTPDAPPGTRGLSVFLVPRFLPDAQGRPGIANDVRCIGLEHKLGLHATPTCTMALGEADGATGFLVGGLHGGMAAMFTMMNNARLTVGLQGVAIAERAAQIARGYASVRLQGARPGAAGPVAIRQHSDVARMLLEMDSRIMAARAMAYWLAAAIDRGRHGASEAVRSRAALMADLLTPIVKAEGSETGVDVASLAIQVLGGMGYIEESGVAQCLRDARIGPIYEGTNGIQAMDLVFRKIRRDGGEGATLLLDTLSAMIADPPPASAAVATRAVRDAIAAGRALVAALVEASNDAAASRADGAVRSLALLTGATLLLAGATYGEDKRLTALAHYYIARRLPMLHAHVAAAEWEAGWSDAG
jgi:alkylation response protein AidB-like acyl-CoA dehydrogenase